jgi:hypothetical protein
MFNFNLRKSHGKIAPILFIPLLISALTGVAYRLGRTWFGISDQLGNSILAIHEGKFLGEPLVPFYVLLLGLGLAVLIATGMIMFKQGRNHRLGSLASNASKVRYLHRFLAPIFFLPLFISTITGLTFRLSQAWFGLSEEQTEIFMNIHQGNYLGPFLRVIYVLLIGLGLLGILVTGMQMTGIFRKRTASM